MANGPIYISVLFLLTACSVPVPDNSGQPMNPDRPNILWLVCEDQSPHFFPMYGDSTVALPNVERLAREGVVYDNVYTPAPVCSPARSAIITGMYPTTIGTHNMRTYNPYAPENLPDTKRPNYSPVVPELVKCFTEYLRREGYYCLNNDKEDYNFKTPDSAWDDSSDTASWKNKPPGQPFFAVYNFMVTHESRVWVNGDKDLQVDPSEIIIPPFFPDDSVIRHDLAVNYSNLKRLDHQIGELLAQLEKDGLLENTIIFFFSDHGGPFPRYKRSIYETGIKVPMIIRFPHQENAGTRNDNMISFIDFAPTVLSLAVISPPDYMQGQAFLGPYKKEGRNMIFTATDRFDEQVDRRRAVRSKRYKYIKNFYPEKPYALPIAYRMNMPLMQRLKTLHQDNQLNEVQRLWMAENKPPEELYDLNQDPLELHNLTEEALYADTLKKYRELLDQWIKKTHDLGKYPEHTLIDKWLVNGNQPKLEKPESFLKEGLVELKNVDSGATLVWKYPESSRWQIYQKPLGIEGDISIQAKAVRIGFKDSEVIAIQSNSSTNSNH